MAWQSWRTFTWVGAAAILAGCVSPNGMPKPVEIPSNGPYRVANVGMDGGMNQPSEQSNEGEDDESGDLGEINQDQACESLNQDISSQCVGPTDEDDDGGDADSGTPLAPDELELKLPDSRASETGPLSQPGFEPKFAIDRGINREKNLAAEDTEWASPGYRQAKAELDVKLSSREGVETVRIKTGAAKGSTYQIWMSKTGREGDWVAVSDPFGFDDWQHHIIPIRGGQGTYLRVVWRNNANRTVDHGSVFTLEAYE